MNATIIYLFKSCEQLLLQPNHSTMRPRQLQNMSSKNKTHMKQSCVLTGATRSSVTCDGQQAARGTEPQFEAINQLTAREAKCSGAQYFCVVSINKRIPRQGHWINPTTLPSGREAKISSSVHSDPGASSGVRSIC